MIFLHASTKRAKKKRNSRKGTEEKERKRERARESERERENGLHYGQSAINQAQDWIMSGRELGRSVLSSIFLPASFSYAYLVFTIRNSTV